MNRIAFSEFKQRREQLLAQLSDNCVVVITAAKEVTRSRDTEYGFRQNSDFHYLTGFPEPDAWLILEKIGGVSKSTIVCRVKDKAAEIWQGRRIGKALAKQEYLFDESASLDELDQVLQNAVNDKQTLYWAQGEDFAVDETVFALLAQLRASVRKGLSAPDQQIDIRPLLHEMRLVKSASEIKVMQQACEISASAHTRAMLFSAQQIKQQHIVTEYQLEAEIHHHFAMHNARYPAYGTIVGSGDNACILHYTENKDPINPDDLVLIDAGCELQGYAADITRTFPVSGQFSPEQKAIYQLVLDTQQAVFTAIKPGATLKQLTDLSIEVITNGLIELGILHGELNTLIEEDAHRAYYMHGLSHWLGLDVHDVGLYNLNGEPRPLKEGMVFTVEPGIYIDAESECDPKWHGIGVRIEDNIVITQDGFENLTHAVPKTIEEIEKLMA
ncbi:Xaa-Pro aminopeptidase [Psychrosphaera saromensis]|uniref:Xaa-Pro aminopeptidase n=1 Tax=Psychrosphaera saromensis TaxID=716813 RepID=A0A2S7UX63_9GAMM|nr:Xaa-Pro aminopeptidase [Psychrosphaera saromensis]PQJ54533.1 Xaa-Pro aminopeptidase [Psychrosphaera saromensis]GHB59163.1 Xaa-Pro aminopeptidase [Psychrosphaera saromensis]GLQ14259.1 Xaa-Pro aminopeptidase [Psychrosphaera saromensis]